MWTMSSGVSLRVCQPGWVDILFGARLARSGGRSRALLVQRPVVHTTGWFLGSTRASHVHNTVYILHIYHCVQKLVEIGTLNGKARDCSGPGNGSFITKWRLCEPVVLISDGNSDKGAYVMHNSAI